MRPLMEPRSGFTPGRKTTTENDDDRNGPAQPNPHPNAPRKNTPFGDTPHSDHFRLACFVCFAGSALLGLLCLSCFASLALFAQVLYLCHVAPISDFFFGFVCDQAFPFLCLLHAAEVCSVGVGVFARFCDMLYLRRFLRVACLISFTFLI